MPNIVFLIDFAELVNLDFGLIHHSIYIKEGTQNTVSLLLILINQSSKNCLNFGTPSFHRLFKYQVTNLYDGSLCFELECWGTLFLLQKIWHTKYCFPSFDSSKEARKLLPYTQHYWLASQPPRLKSLSHLFFFFSSNEEN